MSFHAAKTASSSQLDEKIIVVGLSGPVALRPRPHQQLRCGEGATVRAPGGLAKGLGRRAPGPLLVAAPLSSATPPRPPSALILVDVVSRFVQLYRTLLRSARVAATLEQGNPLGFPAGTPKLLHPCHEPFTLNTERGVREGFKRLQKWALAGEKNKGEAEVEVQQLLHNAQGTMAYWRMRLPRRLHRKCGLVSPTSSALVNARKRTFYRNDGTAHDHASSNRQQKAFHLQNWSVTGADVERHRQLERRMTFQGDFWQSGGGGAARRAFHTVTVRPSPMQLANSDSPYDDALVRSAYGTLGTRGFEILSSSFYKRIRDENAAPLLHELYKNTLCERSHSQSAGFDPAHPIPTLDQKVSIEQEELWAGAEQRLCHYLIGRCGGPQLYVQAHGPVRLRWRHRGFAVTPSSAEEWTRLMAECLEEVSCGSTSPLALECVAQGEMDLLDTTVRDAMMDFFHWMSSHLVNSHDR